jgi:hypothetical protein
MSMGGRVGLSLEATLEEGRTHLNGSWGFVDRGRTHECPVADGVVGSKEGRVHDGPCVVYCVVLM